MEETVQSQESQQSKPDDEEPRMKVLQFEGSVQDVLGKIPDLVPKMFEEFLKQKSCHDHLHQKIKVLEEALIATLLKHHPGETLSFNPAERYMIDDYRLVFGADSDGMKSVRTRLKSEEEKTRKAGGLDPYEEEEEEEKQDEEKEEETKD